MSPTERLKQIIVENVTEIVNYDPRVNAAQTLL